MSYLQWYCEQMIRAAVELNQPKPTAAGQMRVQEIVNSGSPLGREIQRLRSDADNRIQAIERERQDLAAQRGNLLESTEQAGKRYDAITDFARKLLR